MKFLSLTEKVDILILLVSALAVSTILIIKRLLLIHISSANHKKIDLDLKQAEGATILTSISRLEPIKLPTSIGLVCGATAIGGKLKQEDAWDCLEVDGNLALVVADGISSSSFPHLASQAAVHTFLDSVKSVWSTGRDLDMTDLKSAFKEAQSAVAEQAKEFEDINPPATTLIVAIEQKDKLLIGYIGDGAAVLTTGDLKWINNQLYPHTGPASAISGFLGASSCQTEPTVIELPKYWFDGGIILLGSDGALAQGNVIHTAKDILDEIQADITSHNTILDPEEAAKQILNNWVAERLNTDDNRTLGILISREALANWLKLKSILLQTQAVED